MNFNFIGTLGVSELDSKRPYLREGKTKNGNVYKSFNANISNAKNNMAFVEMFGMKQDSIKTKSGDGEDIVIQWEDRFDEDILEDVASYAKHVVNIDERKEFLSDYDYIEHLCNNIDLIKGERVQIRGRVRKSIYQGKIQNRYEIQSFYLVDEDSEVKNSMRITMEFFFTKESFDVSEWKDSKKIYIDGYTKEYVDKEIGTKYMPQRIILDASKVDFENERHKRLLDFRLKVFGLVDEDGKIKVNLKGTEYYSLSVICNYVNGAEEITEISLDDLTEMQRMAVEIGMKTLADFQPKGNVFGDRITELRVIDFNLNNDYADGMIVQGKLAELEEEIYYPSTEDTASVAEEVEKAVEKIEKVADDEDELDDLFG